MLVKNVRPPGLDFPGENTLPGPVLHDKLSRYWTGEATHNDPPEHWTDALRVTGEEPGDHEHELGC